MTRGIPLTESAKLLRRRLRGAFPGITFSVRSSSCQGGTSINVTWTDGPALAEVEAIARPYAGAAFDSLIDMKYHVYAWLLPDGTVAAARSPGTYGQRGSHPPYDHPAPVEGAESVHFEADFVFCRRTVSASHIEAAQAHLSSLAPDAACALLERTPFPHEEPAYRVAHLLPAPIERPSPVDAEKNCGADINKLIERLAAGEL